MSVVNWFDRLFHRLGVGNAVTSYVNSRNGELATEIENHVWDKPWWWRLLFTFPDPLNVYLYVVLSVVLRAVVVWIVTRVAGPHSWWPAIVGMAFWKVWMVAGPLAAAGWAWWVERATHYGVRRFEWEDPRDALWGILLAKGVFG